MMGFRVRVFTVLVQGTQSPVYRGIIWTATSSHGKAIQTIGPVFQTYDVKKQIHLRALRVLRVLVHHRREFCCGC